MQTATVHGLGVSFLILFFKSKGILIGMNPSARHYRTFLLFPRNRAARFGQTTLDFKAVHSRGGSSRKV